MTMVTDNSKQIAIDRTLYQQVMVPNYAPPDMIPVRGLGTRVWDQAGKEYIDFAGGIAVTALGHCHPAMVMALCEQSEKLWHLSNTLANEPAILLAKKLVDATFADKIFFCNSGAEANEAAFKLARRTAFNRFGGDKNEIVACHQSFHGRTLFTVTVGGQPKYLEGFTPAPAGVVHGHFNDLASIAALVNSRTCAIVVEPIQGEGGVRPATVEFLQGLRALANRHQALLIFDEVQSGMGRTGYLYAYQHYGVIPDVLTSAKALGGGFPIGAMLATAEVAQHLSFGTHGSTYGGNPLACAVAGAVFDHINQPSMLAQVSARHQYFMKALTALQQRYDMFLEARGLGLLLGLELKGVWKGRAKEVTQAALKEGLLLLVAGPDVLRFAPALIISQEDIDLGLAALARALRSLVGQ